MEYYLMNDIENWFIVKKGFIIFQDELGQPLEFEIWTNEIEIKA